MSSQVKLSMYGALATMATALSLFSVFSSTDWIVPVMGGVIIVAGACALIRFSPLPSMFEPITAALGVLIWLTVLDARSRAHAGVVPGRQAFRHLGHIARNGFTEIHRLPTPAPAHRGLVLLTVVGVSAIALVVDLLAVTLRRAALAGLPLLALFTVSAATGHHGVGIPAFIVAATGYLWLLYADNREKVARWGAAVGTGKRARPASAWSTDPSSAPPPASLGRQVGAVAISLGVVVPLLIPGLHTGIGKHGGAGDGSGSGNGSGHVTTFNPIVKIGADLNSSVARPVLTYRTSAATPGYLRLTSLDLFDGNAFTANSLSAPSTSAASETLPVSPQPPTGNQVTTSINVLGDAAYRWLPAPATVLGVSVSDAWRYDPVTDTVFSATTDTRNLNYTTRSVPNQPSAAALASAGAPSGTLADEDMTTPKHMSAAVKTLTRHVTAGADNDYQRALDIERFFTNSHRFTYDTTIPPDNSSHALADFLLHTRRGFCQQYATAMAVMARLSGIPARVAVGFTRGTKQNNGTWLVTTHDAHAWPELWFQGYGWLAFEPTPRSDGQAVPPPYADPNQKPGGSKPSQKGQIKPNPSPSQTLRPGSHPVPSAGGGSTNSGGSGGSGAPGGSIAAAVIWVLVLLIALGLLVPGIARAILRQRRWRQIEDPAHGPAIAWAELRDSAVDFGLPWDDDRSPRQIAAALLADLDAAPEVREAMRRLVRCEEHSRYAPAPAAGLASLKTDVLVVRSAATARISTPHRVRVAVLPRSILLVARSALSQLVGRWDRLWHSRRKVAAAVRRRSHPLRT